MLVTIMTSKKNFIEDESGKVIAKSLKYAKRTIIATLIKLFAINIVANSSVGCLSNFKTTLS